jgi:hypothetical protein
MPGDGPESIAFVVDELRTFLNDSLAALSYATLGLMREREALAELGTQDNPDPTIHIVPNLTEPVVPYTRWKLSEARVQLARSGPVEQRLSQQWIVYTYTAWEHGYRARLEAAHGYESGRLKVPLFGDLRRLRNDVVHHLGVATQENSGRCEVVGHWVTIGEPIHVGSKRLAEFWGLVPWSELESQP